MNDNGGGKLDSVFKKERPLMRHEAGVASPDHSAPQDFWIVQSKNSASGRNSTRPSITAAEYGTLQDAYDHFNVALFGGTLPQVLITLQRRGRARGYFCRKRFQRRDKGPEHIHEVALNPDSFTGRSDEEILSTLVHEMVHVWQQEQGHPGRGRYHNREWAAKMHAIGLMASTTGKPGGAVTGDSVSHYVLQDGLYVPACRRFLQRYRLMWESATERDEVSETGTIPTSKAQTRAKFSCPNCGLNAWAKPDALIDCHKCTEEARETVLMRSSAWA